MIRQKGRVRIEDVIIFVALCLTSMNFYAKFFYLTVGLTALFFLFNKKININITTGAYLILSLIMAFYNINEGAVAVIRCFAYFMMYILGYNLLKKDKKSEKILSSEHWGLLVAGAVSIGSFLHFTFNFIYNYKNFLSRNTIDIWSHEAMAATGQSALATVMIGFAIANILLFNKVRNKVFGICALLIMLAYNLILACRTMVILIVVVLLIGLIFLLRNNKSTKKRVKIAIIFTAVFLLILFLISIDFMGIKGFIEESNLFSRFGDSSVEDVLVSGRNEAKLNFIQNALNNPFGGLHMREKYGYAHDLLLDGYDQYGILGGIMLVAILVISIRSLYRLVKKSNTSTRIRGTYLCIYVAIFLIFCVEPIIEGMPWLLACFCLLNGCVDAMNENCLRINN